MTNSFFHHIDKINEISNYLIKKGLSDKAVGVVTRQASSAIGGASAGMFSGTVEGVIQGKDLIDVAKQGFSSALSGRLGADFHCPFVFSSIYSVIRHILGFFTK